MSGRSRPRPGRRAPAPPPAPRPRRAWLLLLLPVAAAAALLTPIRGCRPRPQSPVPLPVDVRALVDSVLRAEERHDWAAAVRHVQRIADAEPGNATALMALGKEWSNYAWSGERYGRERAAQRSSLDRARIMRFALALEDSATRLASDPRERSSVQLQWGRLLELMGMPIDALGHYSEAFAADSTDPAVRERIGTAEAALRSAGTASSAPGR